MPLAARLTSLLMPERVALSATKPHWESTPVRPESSAAARMPGMMSTKTSDRDLMTACRGFMRVAAACLTSAMVLPPVPVYWAKTS